MRKAIKNQNCVQKNYEAPKTIVIRISCADIISASGEGDKNQGAWDPQDDSDNDIYSVER